MKIHLNSDKLKHLRVAAGWTQERLADEAGMHSRTVQRIESDGLASVQSLDRLALALQLEPGDLLLEQPPQSDISYTPEQATQWIKTYAKQMERIERWHSYSWVGSTVFLLGGILLVSCMWMVKQNLSQSSILNVLLPGAAVGLVLMAIGAYFSTLTVRAEKEKRALETMSQLGIPPWLKLS